jgi:hypothetical protein
MTREYRTAAAFKQALEQRLRTASTSGIDFARLRQLVGFDRFLARITRARRRRDPQRGLAIELRIERARTTADVDLRAMGSPDDILARLDTAAMRDLGDFMLFSIRPHDRHPEVQNDGMQYDGFRFRAECSLGAARLRAALDQTFDFRGTHAVPDRLVAPPDTWVGPYANIAKEDQLRWLALDEVFEAARAFLDPVLAGLTDSEWDPDGWSWSGGGE